MGEIKDIRWLQRFANFNRAFLQLKKFLEKGELNEFEEQGLIQSFEYTFELAWNVIKDFYEDQGEQSIQGSKDAFRLAFKRGLIAHGEEWMEMVESRKLTVHTYNEKTANEIVKLIRQKYFKNFKQLHLALEAIRSGNPSDLLQK